MKTLKITYKFLVSLDACETYLETFDKIFPYGVVVTEELAVRHAEDFDWEWAITRLLEGESYSRALRMMESQVRELEDAVAVARDTWDHTNHSTEASRIYFAERTRAESSCAIEYARIFARHFIEQNGRELLSDESRRTSGGVELTDEVLDRLAQEAEEGYNIETLRPRPKA